MVVGWMLKPTAAELETGKASVAQIQKYLRVGSKVWVKWVVVDGGKQDDEITVAFNKKN